MNKQSELSMHPYSNVPISFLCYGLLHSPEQITNLVKAYCITLPHTTSYHTTFFFFFSTSTLRLFVPPSLPPLSLGNSKPPPLPFPIPFLQQAT